MNPSRPDILEFASEDKSYSLNIPRPPRGAALQWEGKRYKWPEIENPHPKLVLFNTAKKQVILLGGLGDPGTELGSVYIYSRRGDLIKFLALKDSVHGLEAMSRRWRKLSNFPWLAAAGMSRDEGELLLWVCRKRKVTINLESFSISMERSSDPESWDDLNPVSDMGL